MKRNQGYTLIEAIIVIAIIAIFSGMSFVTVGIIKQAQATEAASTLSNQIGSLSVKTKALSEASNKPLCLGIVYNSSDVTYSDGTFAKAGSYSLILGNDSGGGTFVSSTDAVPEAILPKIIKLQYTAQGSSSATLLDGSTGAIIEFNKSNGSVNYGAGKYEVIYGDNVVATVILDAITGSHHIQ